MAKFITKSVKTQVGVELTLPELLEATKDDWGDLTLSLGSLGDWTHTVSEGTVEASYQGKKIDITKLKIQLRDA